MSSLMLPARPSRSVLGAAGRAMFTIAAFAVLCTPGRASSEDLQAALNAVVRIVGTREGAQVRGTGFVIAFGPAGAIVVTSSHVVEGAQFDVTFAAGPMQTIAIEDVRFEAENRNGLAVFRVRGNVPPALRMLELAGDRPQVNQSLSLIGYPEMAPSPLTLSRRFAGQKGLLYALDQRVGEGLSGGPVVLDGRAIGMVTAVDGEFTYAVPTTVIREFLRGSDILLPDTAVQPQGQAAPPPQVNPDPVNLVLDEAGLMWTKMDNGQDITWNEAMILCESLSIGGNRDWRLPTIEELERLYDPGGVVNIKRPFQLTFRSLWSSTRAGPDTAWMFDFPDGRRYPVSLGSYTRLLCVRGPVR